MNIDSWYSTNKNVESISIMTGNPIMQNNSSSSITKSDFLLSCEAPRHLWAKKNGKIEAQLSDFDQHLIDQGYEVEILAKQYLETILLPLTPHNQFFWQQTYLDGPFEARCDALVLKPETNTYDLYEIKSSTSVDKENIYDVTYQALVLNNQISIDHFFLLHLDKEYSRSGVLDLSGLFIADDVTYKVNDLLQEVEGLRQEALDVTKVVDLNLLAHCLSPKECPCPDICHPNLPDFSIYDIPRLTRKKKTELLDAGIIAAKDIPGSFELNDKQRLVVDLARTNFEYIDKKSLCSELNKIEFPVYFLDYETCISAIPQYDGYHAQQQIVFQYSLHRMDNANLECIHTGFISITNGEPSVHLLEHLAAEIGAVGTIIVWNKSFEMTMNKDMAKLHPEFAEVLEQVNNRIYDLGEVVNKGYYLHPGFKGSWSIKHVLPVMVEELSYKELAINKGDQASMAWWKATFGQLNKEEIKQITEALHIYCGLDTLAMVEIYKKLIKLLNLNQYLLS
jgi:hypothetical protein